MVGDVLALSELPRNLSGESVTYLNLKKCIATVTGGDHRSFSEICKLPLHLMWSFQELVPKLDSLATIAAELDVPLTRFFDPAADPQSWADVAARVAPLSRQTALSHEKVRNHLREALAENPAPRLFKVANRLGFKSSDALRRIDRDLSASIHKRFVESVRRGEQRSRKASRISQRVDINRTLLKELGRERPDSLAAIARRLGYVYTSEIRRLHPDLCNAISAKLKDLRVRRLKMEREELNKILREDPSQNLPEVAKRLGYSSLTMLMQNHAELCASIIARRKLHRTDALTTMAGAVEEMLKSPSVAIQEILAVIGNQKRFFRRRFPELYRRVLGQAKDALLRKRTAEIEKAESTVKRVFDELASSGTQVSNTDVMRRLPSEPYLWSKNVARIIRKIRIQQDRK